MVTIIATWSEPCSDNAKTLSMFSGLYRGNTVGGLVLHGGDRTYPLGEGSLAAPIRRVL